MYAIGLNLTSSLSEDEDAALLAAIMEARVVLFLESLSSHSENNSLNLRTKRFCKEYATHTQRVVAETVRDRSFLSLNIFPLGNLLTCKRKHEARESPTQAVSSRGGLGQSQV